MRRRYFIALLAALAAAAGIGRWKGRPRPAGPAAASRAAVDEGAVSPGAHGHAAGSRAPGVPGASPPAHHDPDGGFRNPWPTAHTREPGGFLRWQRERRSTERSPDPVPEELPRVEPELVRASASPPELRVTWVGHATLLIQIGALNFLTDPHWSRRASPVRFAGPARFTEPGLAWERLPRIDAVLLSHDHYDHLDDKTVRRLHDRFGDSLRWFTPLEYRDWFRRRGVERLTELDWWQESLITGAAGPVRVIALPCQHWTRRTPWDGHRRLWASWAVLAPGGESAYFGGDSGYFPGYPEIRRRVATSFDAVIMPIGAYEPRWFMRPAHMNPAEAVQAYRDLGESGTMIPMHWGTWRLSDEPPLEPPVRTRAAWTAAGLPPERLRVLRHGETWVARRAE